MGGGRTPGPAGSGVAGDVERLGAAMADLGAQQALILERVDRLVELNEQMWDHHLQFCGRLIEAVIRTDVELLEAQSELGRRLDALRAAAPEG
jgi:hypothetical protein